METITMSKKKELKAHIMKDDKVYVTFLTAISLGLLILGSGLAFHG